MPGVGGVFSSVVGFWLFAEGVGVSEPSRVGLCDGVRAAVSSSQSANLELRKPFSGDLRSRESLNRPGEDPVCTLCMRRW